MIEIKKKDVIAFVESICESSHYYSAAASGADAGEVKRSPLLSRPALSDGWLEEGIGELESRVSGWADEIEHDDDGLRMELRADYRDKETRLMGVMREWLALRVWREVVTWQDERGAVRAEKKLNRAEERMLTLMLL